MTGPPTGAELPPAPTGGFRRAIGLRHAVALYVGSVIGTGILVLPGLTAQLAGPAALLAWGLLAAASVPMALMFAGLSARRPETGGVYAFANEAFGRPTALATGWLFLIWQVTGGPAVARIAAAYAGYAFPIGSAGAYAIGAGILLVAFLINYGGIVVSARVQLGAFVAIVALMLAVTAVASVHLAVSEFRPFAPAGYLPVGTAAALIFWSFLGYENVSNVAEEFADPARDFRRAVYYSVALVGALYLAVAAVTIGTGAYRAGGGVAPFAALFSDFVGRYAAAATAIVALFIVFAVVNAYTTGMARVTYATARDGGFPSALGLLDARTGAPRRALAVVFPLQVAVLGIEYATHASLEFALLLASGTALVVYLVGAAAGVRLFGSDGPRARPARAMSVFTFAVAVILVPFVGWPVLVPLGALGVGILVFARQRAVPRSTTP